VPDKIEKPVPFLSLPGMSVVERPMKSARSIRRNDKACPHMDKKTWITVFEVTGSGLAMVYALLIASNTGNEVLGFSLLLASAILFAAWGLLDRRWAFLGLQVFYAASAIIGLIRWG